jgi:hypothetical protein
MKVTKTKKETTTTNAKKMDIIIAVVILDVPIKSEASNMTSTRPAHGMLQGIHVPHFRRRITATVTVKLLQIPSKFGLPL